MLYSQNLQKQTLIFFKTGGGGGARRAGPGSAFDLVLAQEGLPRRGFWNFFTPFQGHHYHTLSLSKLHVCLGVEKKILKEIMAFHDMTYDSPFLCYNYYILSFSCLCSGVLLSFKMINNSKRQYWRRFLKKYINRTLFIYFKIIFPWGWLHEMYSFLSPESLPYRCYKPNLVKIGSVVLEKKKLADDGRRRTSRAIGHMIEIMEMQRKDYIEILSTVLCQKWR